jgi:spermidine synthase
VKLVLAAVAVAIPTFCMGATLPALGEAVAPSGQRLGIPVGGLYAINLLGAAAGTLAVPFVLLPRLGVDKTYACAVAGSLTVGLIALAWGASAAVPDPSPASPARSVSRLVLALSAISGLATCLSRPSGSGCSRSSMKTPSTRSRSSSSCSSSG